MDRADSKIRQIYTVLSVAMAGAAIGLLFAPDHGVKTREKLYHKIEEIGSNITTKIKNKINGQH